MKWEYMITNFRSSREWVSDELNKLGEEEWEAIAVTSDGHVLMKRPKGDGFDSGRATKQTRAGFRGGSED